tara:strand:- start:18965 stop:20041 length:1077 start_codon:yes stop_codon:yes gene_type:complete
MKYIIIRLFGVGLALLLVEILWGGWINSAKLNQLNLVRNSIITYDVSDLYESEKKNVIYTRDEYGLRGNYTSLSTIDYLTIGGSTTDQRYIDDNATWQAVMIEEFNKSGKNYTYANAGLDGQSCVGHIKNFEYWFPSLPDFKPSYVILAVGLNDIYRLEREDGSFDELFATDKKKLGLKQMIAENSALWNRYKTFKGAFSAVQHNVGHSPVDYTAIAWVDQPSVKQPYKDLMSPGISNYQKRLEILINLVRSIGAEPIIISQPARMYKKINGKIWGNSETKWFKEEQFNGVDFYEMMKILDEVSQEVSIRQKAMFIHASELLLEDLEDKDFYNDFHLSPSGCKKMGSLLYNILSAAGH